MSNDFEYGSGGIVGFAPPQSNPTVEPEMATLMPSDVLTLTTRLRGDPNDARKRFGDYLFNLGESLEGFGAIRLGAFGFACTATTYLLGQDKVRRKFEQLSRLYGYPILSSAEAIELALTELGAQRIALFGPYPAWLQAASFAYWSQAGFELAAKGGINLGSGSGSSNTLDIYKLRASRVVEAVLRLDWQSADAIVLTGTGAPTLRAIPDIMCATGKPVLSSNLCLGWAVLRAIGHRAALPVGGDQSVLIDGWPARVAR
ncbi:hypothetical protein J4G48_0027845 [Bradyrhizobium barranii subsp. apii]|uniref:maleate cis-trans isomerase family protein n=1 Tax=Bradyrhizobium barranii TaxID=2992140 RepID=UPI001AA101D4|nr:hypothetical protein [Bradyrhizobium barranii]UPT93207.1 hypothetical protein J4G48_0027845 [Bradyrhizobium barranii subsp. apii]